MADESNAPAPQSPPPRWHAQGGTSGATSRRSTRSVVIYVLAGLFLALLTTAIIWVLLIRPPAASPYLLTIHIGAYNDPHYPPRPMAAQDSALLLRHFPDKMKEQPVTKSKELLRAQLRSLTDRTGNAFIVHYSALAVVRDDRVYLLPGDAQPNDETTWLDVADVLSAMSECPVPNKLLILDLAHPIADARIGVLSDRVAETLESMLKKSPPSFHVLCPCRGGQLSWTSDVLQASVLAHYLDQALAGHADANRDGNVTLRELFDFVKPRVDRWTQMNLGIRQEPTLHAEGADFVVMHVGESRREPIAKVRWEPNTEDAQKFWKERDKAWEDGRYRLSPRYFRSREAWELRNLLARAAATGGPVDLCGDSSFSSLQTKRSLAMLNLPKDSELARALFKILTRELDAGKESKVKLQDELSKKLNEDKKANHSDHAWAMMEAFERIVSPTQEQVIAADGAIAALKDKQPYIETLYLKRLADFAAREATDNWPAEKVRLLFRTIRAQQTVIAALSSEPASLLWVSGEIQLADKFRQEGERKLLWGRPSTWDEAARQLESAKRGYESAKQKIDLHVRGRVALDQALAKLPAFVDLWCAWPEVDAIADQPLCAATTGADQVCSRLLVSKIPADDGMTPLDAATHALAKDLGTLNETLQIRIRAAEKEDTPKAQYLRRLLLNSPLLTAGKRADLFEKERTLAVKLHEATDALDQDDIQQGRFTPKSGIALHQPVDTGLLRAGMAAALLRIAGIEVKDVDIACPPPSRRFESGEWTKLERTLQHAWGKDLPDRWRSAEVGAEADLLNRIVSPWEQKPDQQDSSCLFHAKLRESFRAWLKASYQQEAQSLDGVREESQTRSFFLDAADKVRAPSAHFN